MSAMCAVSRAPLEKLLAYKKRMGWTRRMGVVVEQRLQLRLSRVVHAGGAQGRGRTTITHIDGKDGFDELPGLSVFYKDEAGNVYHTYSSYARGNEEVIGAFIYLDMTPKGRNEKEIMDWVKRNDEYDAAVTAVLLPRRQSVRSRQRVQRQA